MNEIKDIIELVNPWWKISEISKELAKSFKREKFKEITKLHEYRQIVILSGLRRVGKTTLLYQIIEELLKKEEPKRIFYFTFDKKVEDLIKVFEIYKELSSVDYKNEKIYVFLDEITKLSGWAQELKIIYDSSPNIKFYLSSSSSINLEEEAIKNLAGRYFLVNITPLNFKEYLKLKGKDNMLGNINLYEKEIAAEFREYLLRSFPETINWKDELIIKDYLRTTIIDKIIKSDLPDKFKNLNTELLFTLIELFFKEPGTYLDYDNLSKSLRISKKTLYTHIFYLEFCYLIRRVKNFRPSTFSTTRKLQRIYPYWWTLAYCYTDNLDKILESLIASASDLKYYWRKSDKEVDFLDLKEKRIYPIEVKNREVIEDRALKNIIYFMKKYNVNEGKIVYNGKDNTITIKQKKIRFIPFWKFLLNSS